MRKTRAVMLFVGMLTVFPLLGCSNSTKPDAEQLTALHTRQVAAAEQAGDYRAAAHHLERLYADQPSAPVAARWARALRYLGRSEDAKLVLAQELERLAREEGPLADASQRSRTPVPRAAAERAALHLEMGKANIAQRNADAALQDLQTALRLTPDDAAVYAALGVAHDLRGAFEQAEGAYRKALSLAPNDPQILNNLGLSRALAGDYATALQILSKAATLPDSPPQVLMNLAFLKKLRTGQVAPDEAYRHGLGLVAAPGTAGTAGAAPAPSAEPGGPVEGRPLESLPVHPTRPPERAPVSPSHPPARAAS